MLQQQEGAMMPSFTAVSHADAAIEYAKQGFYIFPCIGSYIDDWKQAKKPLTPNGFRDASNDPEQVRSWWEKWPNAFIGLPTGANNNLTVIDVDRHEDKEFVGLLMHYANALDCPMVKTSKGHHVYFAYNSALNTRANKRQGIDIRSAGGYVIAQPSSHLPTGLGYELVQGDLSNVCIIPDEILAMLLSPEVIQPPVVVGDTSNLIGVKTVLETIPAENYDEWISVGMALKNDFGEEGFPLWDEWSANSKKYNPKEMRYRWESFGKNPRSVKISCGSIHYLAKQYEVKEHSSNKGDGWGEPMPLQSELLPVKELSPEMLPEPIRDWVTDIAERMNCPADYVAVDAIVTLGALIGSRCRIQPKQFDTGWKVVPNLWGAVVAEPGMKKSPALEASLEFIHEMERQNLSTHKEAQLYFEAEMEQYKAQKETPKDNKSVPVLKPTAPVMRRLVINNSSVEKLGAIAAENPRGLLVLADELSAVLSKLDDRDNYQDRSFYLQAWNGDSSYTFDRIERGTIPISCLCLSVLGNIQPEKLQQYIGNVRRQQNNDGMMQRFQMLVYPDTPVFTGIVDRIPNEIARQKAKQLFHALANADFSVLGARMEDEKAIFKFSNAAQPMAIEWLNQLERRILAPEEEPLVRQHLSKYRGLMPTLALISHLVAVVSNHQIGDVSAEATQQAIAWCDYLESHARRVYAGRGGNDYGTVQLAKMIQAGKLGEVFSMRGVYRNQPSGLIDGPSTQTACDTLEALGWIKSIEAKGKKYQVNPHLLKARTLH